MLTSHEIQRQMDLGNIQIDNLKPNALEKPNSCIISMGDTLFTYDYGVLDPKEKPEMKDVRIPPEGLLLEPHHVYLALTNEKVNTDGYVPVLHGRTSLSLLGLSIELNSGYSVDKFDGRFLLSIVATMPTIIYPNIEVGNLTFFKSINSKEDAINLLEGEEIGMLSGKEIQRQMETGNIVITPQDNIVINPNSVNLSLNRRIGYYTNPILDIAEDNPIAYMDIDDEGIFLYPDKIYLARTNEWTKTLNYIPMMSGRSSLGRLGYHVHCSAGMGSLGYEGYWHMGVRPKIPIRVYADMKCCQIYYFTAEGLITSSYEGSMQALPEDELGSQYYKKMPKGR